jgi:hypothetical protein
MHFGHVKDEVEEYHYQDKHISVVLDLVDDHNEAVSLHGSAQHKGDRR